MIFQVTPRDNGCGFRLRLLNGIFYPSFFLQLRGPFNHIVRAGLTPITACSLIRRTKFTRPLQRLSSIGRDYMPNSAVVNR
jgi:hypothetical protein